MTNEEQETQQNGRRSIRDIPIPRRRPAQPAAQPVEDVRPARAERHAEEAEPVAFSHVEEELPPIRRAPEPAPAADEEELPPEPPRAYRSDRARRRGFRWGRLSLIALIIVGAIVVFTWHSATVTVAQRTAERSINLAVPVSIDGAATGTVPAKSVRAITRAEKLLPATGEATVQSKAGGTITIYNDYSDEAQALVRNTRFETPTGLVFRIQDAVTVPGKTSAGPGSIQARVTADQVGEEYNVGPIARFTVPGFAGKPQFDSFYAKSEGSMTGGFNGVQKVADPAAVAAAVDELTEQLRGEVTARAAAEAGEGYQAFAVPASFAVLATGREPAGNEVKVWVEAQADAYAVGQSDFADAIAAVVLSGYRAKGEARIDNPGDLRVTPKEGGAPALEVVGNAKVTWLVDAEAFEAALLGQPMGSFDQVLGRFGGAERATPVIRPFWRSAFPADQGSIHVVVDGEEDVDA